MSSKSFKCEKCIKCYSSYKSLWNHNNRYHKNEVSYDVKESKADGKEKVRKSKDKINNDDNTELILTDKNYKCKYCNKIYKHKQTRWSHQKICNNNNNNEFIEMKNEINELKQFIVQNCKIHPKKLQKINKQLINNNIINNNTNITLNNTTINNTCHQDNKT